MAATETATASVTATVHGRTPGAAPGAGTFSRRCRILATPGGTKRDRFDPAGGTVEVAVPVPDADPDADPVSGRPVHAMTAAPVAAFPAHRLLALGPSALDRVSIAVFDLRRALIHEATHSFPR